jgi:tRNA(His) 5'-end guanylyltransferase
MNGLLHRIFTAFDGVKIGKSPTLTRRGSLPWRESKVQHFEELKGYTFSE